MSRKKIEILEGALFISDAHYSKKRPELRSLLSAIATKSIQTPQLVLMGDIFDTLFGSIEYTYKQNQNLIETLEKISLEISVVYLEGNHDFNLKNVFKNMQIFPIEQQPVLCSFKDKSLYLAHGDFDGKLGYKLYTKIIRNRVVLQLLRVVDNISKHAILNYVDKHLEKKEDCKKLEWFEEFIKNRFINRLSCDYFIEGHFHQNRAFVLSNMNYINLAAFACNQRYFIVKSSEDKELYLEENSH